MSRKQYIYYYVLIFIAIPLFIPGCSSESTYPNNPQITSVAFHSYKYVPVQSILGKNIQDSIIIAINVKAGVANLGNDYPLPSTSYNNFLTHGNWGNYKITTFRLSNGKFDTLSNPIIKDMLFFPSLTNSKSLSVKEGILYFNKIFLYTKDYKLYPTKFQIKIRDNDLNESNVIETDTIIVPYP